MATNSFPTICINCGIHHDIEVENCYCDEDQGAGYTYSDEHGDCDNCEKTLNKCPSCNKSMVCKED